MCVELIRKFHRWKSAKSEIGDKDIIKVLLKQDCAPTLLRRLYVQAPRKMKVYSVINEGFLQEYVD